MKKELTLEERELLCSSKGATWNLPFKHEIADRWRIPRFKDELTQDELKLLGYKKQEFGELKVCSYIHNKKFKSN